MQNGEYQPPIVTILHSSLLLHDPYQRFSTQEVEVKMWDDLPAICPTVHDELIPTFADSGVFRKLTGDEHETSHEHGIACGEIPNRWNVRLRNDEHMRRRLRMDVVEYDAIDILVPDTRRNLLRGNLAEETIGHRVRNVKFQSSNVK